MILWRMRPRDAREKGRESDTGQVISDKQDRSVQCQSIRRNTYGFADANHVVRVSNLRIAARHPQ